MLRWASRFKQLNLKKIDNSYSQTYSFPVNSFPYEIRCKVDGINKIAGTDFLVDAGCLTMHGEVKLLHFNMKDSVDQLRFYAKIRSGFEGYEGVVLHFLSAKNNTSLDSFKLYHHMPALLIRTEEKKLTWTVSTVVNEIPSLTFIDSSLRDADHIQLNIRNQFIDSFACKNLCAARAY